MRKSLWIITLVSAAIGTPNARADVTEDYTITFTATSGTLLPAPNPVTLVYDQSTNAFTTVPTIVYNTSSFNFLNSTGPNDSLNNPLISSPSPTCIGADTGVMASVDLLTTCQGTAGVTLGWFGADDGAGDGELELYALQPCTGGKCSEPSITLIEFTGDCPGATKTSCVPTTDTSGSFSVSESAVTPEPGTAVLWLTGIGLMVLTRKRIAHLLRRDTGTHRSLSPH